MPPSECSRSLLTPGPQPPLTHFGATLLRQVVTTGLRFAFHSLGAPLPEGAPIRIVRLRFYLDRSKLDRALEGSPLAELLTEALLDPGGKARPSSPASGLGGALMFHRLRLRFKRRRRTLELADSAQNSRTPWDTFQLTLKRVQPLLNDALLRDLIGSIERRAVRQTGRDLAPCLGPDAYRFHAATGTGGGKSDISRLESLGVPDPFVDSWQANPEAIAHLSQQLSADPRPAVHRYRGEFRESYRRALNVVRPAYLRLAAAAQSRGLLGRAADAFFIPFDLAEDLTQETRPDWLAGAVNSNRLEYQSLLDVGGPPEVIHKGESTAVVEDRSEWALGPVWPLE